MKTATQALSGMLQHRKGQPPSAEEIEKVAPSRTPSPKRRPSGLITRAEQASATDTNFGMREEEGQTAFQVYGKTYKIPHQWLPRIRAMVDELTRRGDRGSNDTVGESRAWLVALVIVTEAFQIVAEEEGQQLTDEEDGRISDVDRYMSICLACAIAISKTNAEGQAPIIDRGTIDDVLVRLTSAPQARKQNPRLIKALARCLMRNQIHDRDGVHEKIASALRGIARLH